MRATWPTARKSESEPVLRPEPVSETARATTGSSGYRSFFVDAAPLMPHVLPPPGGLPMSLPRELPRELQGSGAAYSGGACRSPSVRRLGAAILCGEGMRGGPSARRNMRAAEYFSPVPSAAAALLFPNPFSPRFLPPSSSLRRLGAASSSERGCGVVRPPVGICGRRSISPRFLLLLPPFFSRILSLPGSFRHRPPCGAWERPSSTGRGCGVVRPPVGMCGRRSVSLRFLLLLPFSPRFLLPALPSFSRCRSGPRDFSGKRCGGEK